MEFGGLKLPDNEQNRQVIAALQAEQHEIFPGAEQTLQRRATIRKASKTNVNKGMEELNNMDLRTRFEPKDGVNLYE